MVELDFNPVSMLFVLLNVVVLAAVFFAIVMLIKRKTGR